MRERDYLQMVEDSNEGLHASPNHEKAFMMMKIICMYTPSLGSGVAVSGREREQSRFRRSIVRAASKQWIASRRSEGTKGVIRKQLESVKD